jgi:hypothetical protein
MQGVVGLFGAHLPAFLYYNLAELPPRIQDNPYSRNPCRKKRKRHKKQISFSGSKLNFSIIDIM